MLNFVPVIRQEYKSLHEMASLIWHQHYPGIITVGQIDYMLELMYSEKRMGEDAASGYHFDWLAVDDKRIGFMAYKISEDRLFLSKLYVLPDEHGKGWGKMALGRLFSIGKEQDLTDIWLYVNKKNTKAIRAYDRFGFVVIDEIVNDIGQNYVMDDFIMSCKLK